MNTSYFAINANNPNAVSISGKAPEWYTGRQYKKLAPTFKIFSKYKSSNQTLEDEQEYTKEFTEQILNKLDPKVVFEELGKDAVILCYETPEKFCHRHIVAKWLSENLGIEIKELKKVWYAIYKRF